MHLSALVLMWALMAISAAQPRCDPLTQYDRIGECCQMCPQDHPECSEQECGSLDVAWSQKVGGGGRGTSMSSLGTCLEPQCQNCGRNEYQDKYTRKSKCERQPYCDPNRNFQVPFHETTKQSVCECEQGFHCSTEECISCVPHRTCGPGHGVQSMGSHSYDTVCEKCPDGTYSGPNSSDGVCRKWTECAYGKRIEQSGTDISDNTCVETWRSFVVLPVLFVVFVVAALIAAIMCLPGTGAARGKLKECVESCRGEKNEPTILVVNPTQPTEEEEEEEEARRPSADRLLSEGGKFVGQEDGKIELMSMEESQTH